MVDGRTNSFLELIYIIRNIIGKVAILAVIPDLLNRIKLRCIRRQPFQLDSPGKSSLQTSCAPAMHKPAIQNQNNTLWKMNKKLPDKKHKIVNTDVCILDVKIQTQLMTYGRNTDSANGRELVVTFPVVKQRRLASWSPGSTNQRLEHKAAFIQQNDGSTTFSCVFLYKANAPFARFLWPAHCVLWHAVPAFGNCSADEKECTRHLIVDNRHQNSSELSELLFLASTDRFCSHWLWRLLTVCFGVFAVVCLSSGMVGKVVVCWLMLPGRLFCKRLSSVPPSWAMRRLVERFRGFPGLCSAVVQPVSCVVRAVFVFLLV
jgi:hypothetical protein